MSYYPCIYQWALRLLSYFGYCKKKAAMNIGVHISFLVSFCSDKYPEVELLDHTIIQFLIFLGNPILFSTVAAPLYIHTNSA